MRRSSSIILLSHNSFLLSFFLLSFFPLLQVREQVRRAEARAEVRREAAGGSGRAQGVERSPVHHSGETIFTHVPHRVLFLSFILVTLL